MVAVRRAASISRGPLCPRCAYDQTGLIATWTQSCPLAATCTECGYSFDPGDAVDPTRKRLPWLYEHARPSSVTAAFKTACMLLWPPLFWRRVRPEHQVRLARLIALPLVVLIAWPTVIVTLMFIIAFVLNKTNAFGWQGQAALGWGPAASKAWRDLLIAVRSGNLVYDLLYLTPVLGLAGYLALVWLPTAAAFLAVPSAWAGTRLRGRHLVRTLAYAMYPIVLIFTLFSLGSILIQLYEIAYLLALPASQHWLSPWDIESPEYTMRTVAVALLVFWPAMYWLTALRSGYRLPRAYATWGIVMMVHLTALACFLAYLSLVNNAFR